MFGYRKAIKLLLVAGLGFSLASFAPERVSASGWTGQSFTASDAFRTEVQGVDGWIYEDWNGSNYTPMAYEDASFRAWQGRSGYSLIGWNSPDTLHPGTATDTALTFEAPADGQVSITGNVRKRDLNGGDGVQARILKNGTQIWPTSGWQSIAYNDAVGVNHSLSVQVTRGDRLRFVLNRNGNINNDSTYWDPNVAYSSSDAPDRPAVTGVADGGAYPSATPSWTDPTGTTSYATLAKDGGAPAAFASGSSITASGRYVLEIVAERTVSGNVFSSSAKIRFSIGTGLKSRFVASEGYSSSMQGSDHWFYRDWDGSAYAPMTYDSSSFHAWLGRSSYALIGWNGADTVHPGTSTDTVRAFVSPMEGTVNVTGAIRKRDLSGGDGVQARILKNDTQIWPASGWQSISYKDSVGVNPGVLTYVKPGDEIRFVLNRKSTIDNDSTYWDPQIDYQSGGPGIKLHYKHPSHYIGDVHPYWENGTLYLYYLKPGTFEPALVTTSDYKSWQPVALTRSGSAPYQNYYALGVFKDGSVYRSYYGNGTEMKGSESLDLTEWSNASSSYDIANSMSPYTAGARDPYVFWDPDAGVYRMVSSAYRSNQDWGIGSGMDVSIGLTSSVGSSLTSWGTQTDLIRFPNSGVPVGSAQEPEVAQMFKLDNRWYLMASIARQTAHWVGGPTYWIGDPNTSIDADNWASKTAHSLEGEDLAAAQVFYDGAKWIMLGWIPQQATGNAWGGHIGFPRELYALPGGMLGVKLETTFSSAIRGGELYGGVSSPSAETGSWTFGSGTFSSSGTGFSIAKLPGDYSRFDADMTVSMSGSADRAGLLIDKGATSPYGFEISLDKANSLIRVRRDTTGTGNWTNFSQIPVAAGDLDGTNTLRLISEGDILEVFVNDKYALAARISKSLDSSDIRLFSSSGGATFGNVKVYELNE